MQWNPYKIKIKMSVRRLFSLLAMKFKKNKQKCELCLQFVNDEKKIVRWTNGKRTYLDRDEENLEIKTNQKRRTMFAMILIFGSLHHHAYKISLDQHNLVNKVFEKIDRNDF